MIPIFYINISHRTERRAFMEAQFARLDLAVERIEAVTPRDLTASDIALYCDPARMHRISLGECACTLSHLNVMQKLLDTGAPMALVLEDDAILSSRLPAFLSAIERAAPEFDLLHVETSGQRVRVQTVSVLADIEVARYLGYDPGAAGYLVSRRGADRIVSDPRSRQRPFDQAIFDTFSPLGRRLVLRATIPGLCTQTSAGLKGVSVFESDTSRRYGPAGPEVPWNLRQRAYHALRAVRRDTVVALRKQWYQRIEGARLLRIPFDADDDELTPVA